MEENIICTTESNSVSTEEVLQTSITCTDRKRKLQAEELGTHPSKHNSSSRSFGSEYVFSFNANSDGEGVYRCVYTGDLSGMSIADESEHGSAIDSNSFAADADSMISVCNEAEVGADQGYFKQCSSHNHFTSSVDWEGNCSKHDLHFSESSLLSKSSSNFLESKEHDFPHHNMDLQSSMNYEEHLLEFGGHVDYSCSECRTSFEECMDKELEEMLYSNGVTPNNYVLSSGKWTPNRDTTQQDTKKLTIDKEFEQQVSQGIIQRLNILLFPGRCPKKKSSKNTSEKLPIKFNQHDGRSEGGGGNFSSGSDPSNTIHAILRPQLVCRS